MKIVKIVFVCVQLLSCVAIANAADSDMASKWDTNVQTNQTEFQKALDAYNQAVHNNEMVRLDAECQQIQDKINIVLKNLADPAKYVNFDGYVTEFNRLTKILNKRIEWLKKEAK